MTETNSPTLALLGHGPFASPSFDAIRQQYKITDPNTADCLIVANYGKILTKDMLNRPRFGAINLHGSLLPYYRGSTPIQSAIANGDVKTGVTIIKMDEHIDHGPVLAMKSYAIKNNDYALDVYGSLGILARDLLVEILPLYFTNKITLVNQDHSKATYTKKVQEIQYLRSTQSDSEKYNLVRAYSHEPGVWAKTPLGDVKIIQAELKNNVFIPTIVQKPGKKKMPYTEFMRGFRGNNPINALT